MIAIVRSRAFLVTLVIVLAMAANAGWRRIEATRIIDKAGLAGVTSAQAIAVDLDVQPEQFHMSRLQELGTMTGAEGRTVRLFNVKPAAVREIATKSWVVGIRKLGK